MKKFENEKHKNKIIDRIKKILATAESTSFEAEAETAFKIAKGLMATYGLSMSEIEMQEEIEGNIIEAMTDEKGKIFNWEKMLAVAVEELCDTKLIIYHTGRNKSSLKFIGFKDDVTLSIQLYNFLNITLKQLVAKQYKGKRQRNSYLLGMTNCLGRRAKTESQKVKEEVKTYNALVVIKEEEINKYVNDTHKNLKSTSVRSRIDTEAYEKGQYDGNFVDLNNRRKLQ